MGLTSLKWHDAGLFSSERLVFFIGDDSAIFLHLDKGEVLYRLFLSNVYDFNTADLFEYIQKFARIPLYILLSNIDQKYVVKTVPHLGLFGFDLFIKMRLKKDFHLFDIREFYHINDPEIPQSKNEYMFILAKTNAYLDEWINAITRYTINLKGISLFPLGLNRILHDAISNQYSLSRNQNEWTVFIVCTKVSGFTHVVLRGGTMLFSRLVPMMTDVSPNILVGSVYQDIEHTLQFVAKFGFTPQQSVRLFCILPTELKAAFANVANTKMELSIFDVREFVEKTNVGATCLDDRFADTAVCTVIMRDLTDARIFRTEKIREFYLLCLFNSYAPFISIAFILILVILNASMLVGSFLQNDEAKRYTQELSFLQNQVDQSNGSYNMERLNRTNELINMYKALKSLDHHTLKYVRALNGMDMHGFSMTEFDWSVNKQNNKLQIYFGFTAPATGTFFSNYELLTKEVIKTFPKFDVVASKVPESLVVNKQVISVSFSLK